MKNNTLSSRTIIQEKSGLRFLFSGAIILFFMLFPAPAVVLCQLPQGFNYQAIAREGGNPVTTPIGVRLTIQSTALGGTTHWIEVHSAVQPNTSGLFTIVVGAGVKQSGSTANTFNDIDWSVGPKYLKTDINTGSGFVTMGTSQFLSVPYSVIADGLGGALDKLTVAAPVTSTSLTEPLFEVKNNTGQTVFAVYNEGVRVYVDNGAKGPKGGFAIGGFGMEKGGDEYLRVTRDSTRIYINDLPGGKGVKGGFAIGGFGATKTYYNFLKVDETLVKGGKTEYMRFSTYNTFIGEKSGSLIPVANPTYNTFVGYMAGYLNTATIPTYNLFIGNEAGYSNTTGTNNVYIGMQAGRDVGPNAHTNVFIGKWSGYQTTGSDNIFIGNSSGLFNTSGNGNVFLGLSSGYNNSTGYGNLFLASNAGQENTTGWHNVFMGYNAGGKNKTGNYSVYIGAQAGTQNTVSNNTMIGFQSGFSNLTGTGNIFLGYQAGFFETGSDKLYITNVKGTDLATGKAGSLIYGEFNNKTVTINDVLILTPRATAPTSPVNGTIYVSTTFHIYCYLNGIWKQLD